jgi:protein O-GlcNAc transferase
MPDGLVWQLTCITLDAMSIQSEEGASLENPQVPILPASPAIGADSVYRIRYAACPVCGHTAAREFCVADCRDYPGWHATLPGTLTWLLCSGCGHIFTDSYYTPAGLEELFRFAHPTQLATGDVNQQRILWAPVVERVLSVLPHAEALLQGSHPAWLDVGCGAGGLVFTADEFGFAATGLDLREEAVQLIRALGYKAHRGDLLSTRSSSPIQVLSMADLLEHTAFPVAMLRHAHQLLHPEGVLFVSCPNRDSSSWRQLDSQNANPYWRELEHHHNFSRSSLTRLLRQSGFLPVRYAVSNRYLAGMEILCLKSPTAV